MLAKTERKTGGEQRDPGGALRAARIRRYRRVLMIGLLLLPLLAVILVSFWYRRDTYNRIVAQNMDYIEDSTVQEAELVDRNLEVACSLIANMAGQYAALAELTPDRPAPDILSAIHDGNFFDRTAFVTPEGIDAGREGEADVSDRDYYRRGMAGETGWQTIGRSRVTGQPAIVFYSPVTVRGETVGVVTGAYRQERLRAMVTSRMFGYEPRTYLLQADGQVIACSLETPRTGDALALLSGEDFLIGSFEELCSYLDGAARVSYSFAFGDMPDTSVGTIVKLEDSDWMILNLLPYSVTSGMAAQAGLGGAVLEALLVLVFLFYLGVVILAYRRQETYLHQSVASATADLKFTLQEERRQWALIDSLAEIYISIFYLELPTLTYRILRQSGETGSGVPEEGGAVQARDLYCETRLPPEFQEEFRRFMDYSTLGERLALTDTVSMDLQQKDGSWLRLTFACAERDEDGKLLAAILACRLISEEKERELASQAALRNAFAVARQANQAKTVFLSNMSHDMRTPMNAIAGMTAIAQSHLDDQARVAECLRKIAASSRHLTDLINEVLDVSQIESGRIALAEKPFELPDVVEGMLTLNQGLIAQKNHMLILNIHDIVHERVTGDAVRLQEVFTNLLNNAAKFTPEGGHIKFELTELPVREGRGWFQAVFLDDGVGISQEDLPDLFEPYAKPGDTRTERAEGSGLGLPISRNIARMMNGDITVESVLGRGTKFAVTFCLKLQQEGDADDPRYTQMSVLVADGDPSELCCSQEILGGLGVRSECVSTLEEALEKLRARRAAGEDYDAVILGWDENGPASARAVRAESAAAVVACAYDCAEIEQEAREAGVTRFLNKPLFRSRVRQLFGEMLGVLKAEEPKTLQEEMAEVDFSGRRALLAEDNALNREIALEILGMAGLRIETAEDGRQAVERFSASPAGWYDIVLMDIQMPEMNGYEAARAIRALDREDARRVPIVAMSANAFTSDVQEALNAGMNGHVAKPLDLEILKKTLGTFLAASIRKQPVHDT